jgi:hypothetical protein
MVIGNFIEQLAELLSHMFWGDPAIDSVQDVQKRGQFPGTLIVLRRI